MVRRGRWKPGALVVSLLLASVPAVTESADPEGRRYTNRLIDSKAPYLLLHAHNPVDWYPWGPEAFAKAKAEDKPIFLSVGYSTCFWCHVAERTLYADPEIAAVMNRWFVNVKVDREQRPDVDHAYMLARQVIAGSGGWPNNVFLTPDLKPFYAGSYFPPERDEQGRPSFSDVLATIHHAWTRRRQQVLDTARQVETTLRRLQAAGTPALPGVRLEPVQWKNTAVRALLRNFDPLEGGFSTSGRAAKFPQAPALQLLLSEYRHSRDPAVGAALTDTLDAMAYGGIQDHLAGGFHRYSTDPDWSVPHFEKMLYDNAQLLHVYAQAHALFGSPLYRDTAGRIARYLTKRMMAPGGGFYTAEDAQVDGVEGASYVWTPDQIRAVLGEDDAATFLGVYSLESVPHSAAARRAAGAPIPEDGGVLRVRRPVEDAVTAHGTQDIATLLRSLSPLREALLASRDQRKRPLRDDKISVDLNGLAIAGFAGAGRALDDDALVAVAQRTAHRIWNEAFREDTGVLAHQIFQGEASGIAFLADHALFARGLLTLHAVSGDDIWRERAQRLMDVVLERYLAADGRLRVTLAAGELPVQPVDQGDVESPSGTSAAIQSLLTLPGAGADSEYVQGGARALRHLAPGVRRRPDAWPALLTTLTKPGVDARVLAANSGKPAAGTPAASGIPALKTTRDFVTVTGRRDIRGSRVVLTLAVTAGYHINANPATLEFLIPTRVEFAAATPKAIAYPLAEKFSPGFTDTVLDVYEGNAEITADFDAGTLPALESTTATVTAQACNDTVCLPPSRIQVTLE